MPVHRAVLESENSSNADNARKSTAFPPVCKKCAKVCRRAKQSPMDKSTTGFMAGFRTSEQTPFDIEMRFTMNKLLSCRYNIDTNRVETRFEDGTTLAIDCIAVEDECGNTPAQRAELDWLLYNKPLEYAPSLFWAKRLSIIFPSAVTMADWKIKPL